MPSKQPKRSRLGLNDGSCIRRRREHRDDVWSWNFVYDRTDDGRPIKFMVVIDGCTRKCVAINVACRGQHKDVVDVFADLTEIRGVREHARLDNELDIVA